MSGVDTEKIGSILSSMTLKDAIKFAAVIVVGGVVITVLMKLIDKITERPGIQKIYHTFLRTILKAVLWMVVLFIALSAAGVNVTSLLALLSIVGLAISLAAQGVLGNVAGGLQVMSVHPFSTGDYVEIGSTGGTVTELSLLYTVLTTPDNFRVHIPNSTTVHSNITNYTVLGRRRLDIKIGLSYDADPEAVRGALLPLISGEDKVLGDPAPQVLLSAYLDSGVEYTLRMWTMTADYWNVRFSLQEKLWKRLKEIGISIPYPQMDVHLDGPKDAA